MELIIISDNHGYYKGLKKILTEHPKAKIIHCGDVISFGKGDPHDNDYRPWDVIEILNSRAFDIISVRGNCDSLADQTKLKYKFYNNILKIYTFDNITLYISHGHIYNKSDLPDGIKEGDIFISGHTHIPIIETINGITFINPGSTSQPRQKDGKPSYCIYKNKGFKIIEI